MLHRSHLGNRPSVVRGSVAVAFVVGVVALLGACAPPVVGLASPQTVWASQQLDGSWVGQFLACTSGGGAVEVSHGGGGFDTVAGYEVEIFDSWEMTEAARILSFHISQYGDVAASPWLEPGDCFAVRVTTPTSEFAFRVEWCDANCTVVPTPPAVVAFTTSGGPFSAPALVPFSWRFVDPNFDPLTCRIDGDGDGNWDITIDDCPKSGARNLTLPAGEHVARFEVDDGTFAPASVTVAVPVDAGPTEPFDITVETPDPIDAAAAIAIDDAVQRWEAVIATGVSDEHITSPAGNCSWDWPAFDGLVDDVVIRFYVAPLDGPGGTAGTAGVCGAGPDGLQRLGLVIVDSADVPTMSPALLSNIFAHEIGHVLLTGAADWWSFIEGPSDDPHFLGPRAGVEWALLGGEGDPPIQPNNYTHWRYSVDGDVMSSNISPTAALSVISVAALADVGYHVDLSAAEPLELP